ncbi:MAG: bisanhydrobacterioruberin hydratase CruF [Salinibacter sp.]
MSTSDQSQTTLEGNYQILFQFAFWLFVGAISFSVAGMLLLRLVPSTMSIFGPIYTKLVKTPTWTFMIMLGILPLLMYGPTFGWKRMSMIAVWGCLVGGGSELIGTTGILTVGDIPLPFGEYQYHPNWLGPKIAGHVPYFIPPSWFAVSLISLDLARRITTRRWGALLLGTLFMVLWDVSLDPAMNRAFPFWTYGADGFYFGMPLSNWGGWTAVTLVILLGYEFIRGDTRVEHAWAPWVYALNCIFPLAICLLRNLYLPALIGGLATAIPFLLLWRYNPDHLRRAVSLLRA